MDTLTGQYHQALALAEDIGLDTSSRTADELQRLAADNGWEALMEALGKAHDMGKVSLAYIKGILKNPQQQKSNEPKYKTITTMIVNADGEKVPWTRQVRCDQ